ncbi:MAG: nucleoside deaminase [Candidatus Margulisiibacteriota bacterium]|jgi:tRNA(Arg) A34 adenosine deaminase TadA
MKDKNFLKIALKTAKESLRLGGFPAGAVIVKNGKIISKGLSLGFIKNNPTGHSESNAIRKACKILKTSDLSGSTLYASFEPCIMCFSAANWAKISKIVYGTKKDRYLITNGCYEGTTDINKLNDENNKKIELIYIPDFEKESLELFNQWLTNLKNN